MISNHFPGTYSPVFNWIILGLLTIGSVAVRHYINLHEKGKNIWWLLIFAFAVLVTLIYITAPVVKPEDKTPVKFAEVQSVIHKRCLACHSAHPTDDIQKTAPNGIMFESADEIIKQKDRILFRVVQTKTMPQGNKTGITEEERAMIGRWIEQGGKPE